MSNRLVILTAADQMPDESSDILALTLPAMAMLKARGRSFLVLEDIYPHKNVYKDTNDFAERVAEWFQNCDGLCLKHLDVTRAFSSTGFWILHRLSDLNYIHRILDILDARYQHIELYASRPISDPPVPQANFSSLNMPSFGIGLAHVLWFIQAGLPKLIVHASNSQDTDKHSQQVGGEPLLSLVKRLPGILGRRIAHANNKIKGVLHIKVGQVWVVQQGYDVEILNNAFPEWEFAHIRSREISMANSSSAAQVVDLDRLMSQVGEAFFVENFPRYTKWLFSWFQEYYQQVVLKLKHYEQALEERMKADKPAALLYSIGAEDALEEVLCRVANRLSIPVFFFKHGGIAEHFLPSSILDPYLEHNASLQRTQFIHSEVERVGYKGLSSVNTIVSGPLSRTKLNYKKAPKQKNILYSVGPPAHYSFKELRKLISDHERFTFIDDLLWVCAEKNLNLSIKVHPAEWKVAWECIRILNDEIKEPRYRANLIAGGAIERIFSQFGLLVLDMISTKVLSMALGIDIPIVLYLPDDNPVNTENFPDLEKRVYVVRNRQDLADILTAYQQEGLPSKCDHAFVKKYLGCLEPESAMQIVSDQVFNVEREKVC